MPISGTTTNYAGRKRDILVTQKVNPLRTGPQTVNYGFGKPSAFVAGVQKLLQRYVILLFNTGLLNKLQTSVASNAQEATHIFNFANWEVIKTFREYQNSNPGLPEDEQLAGAQLQNLTTDGNKMHITVKITTRAGESIPYVLPIPLQ